MRYWGLFKRKLRKGNGFWWALTYTYEHYQANRRYAKEQS